MCHSTEAINKYGKHRQKKQTNRITDRAIFSFYWLANKNSSKTTQEEKKCHSTENMENRDKQREK